MNYSYLIDKLKIPTSFCPRFLASLNPSEYKLTSPIISLSGFDIATGLKSYKNNLSNKITK